MEFVIRGLVNVGYRKVFLLDTVQSKAILATFSLLEKNAGRSMARINAMLNKFKASTAAALTPNAMATVAATVESPTTPMAPGRDVAVWVEESNRSLANSCASDSSKKATKEEEQY